MNVEIDPVLDASVENTYLASQYVLRTWRAAKIDGFYDADKVKHFRELIATTQPWATEVDMLKNDAIIESIDSLIEELDSEELPEVEP